MSRFLLIVNSPGMGGVGSCSYCCLDLCNLENKAPAYLVHQHLVGAREFNPNKVDLWGTD